MKRKLGCLLVVGALALIALGALAFVEIDSPRLGRALLEQAGAATGARLEAAEFRLSLLRGLSLRNVRASGTMTGGRYEATLDRLVFEHRLLPLFAGRLAVSRVRLVRPSLRLIETGTRAPAVKPRAAASATAGLPLALRIEEIALEDGTLEMRAPQQEPVAVRGLTVKLSELDLAPSPKGPLAGLSGRGEIRIDTIAVAPEQVRDVRGTFTVAGGRFDSPDVRFRTNEGPFTARWTAALDRLPFEYTLALDGTPLDLNAISGLSGRGGAFGAGHVTLEGRGSGPEPEGLTGRGVLKLEKGTLPATPLLTRLEAALGRTRVVGAAYKASETPFRIERGRVSFERFRLEADTLGLDVGGWTSLDGAVDMTLGVRAPRQQVRIAEIPTEVLDALTEDDGWVRLPFRVTGTRLAPRVAPDMAALSAQARRGGAKVLEKKAAEKLRDLFR
jgi:hypothetical protein